MVSIRRILDFGNQTDENVISLWQNKTRMKKAFTARMIELPTRPNTFERNKEGIHKGLGICPELSQKLPLWFLHPQHLQLNYYSPLPKWQAEVNQNHYPD